MSLYFLEEVPITAGVEDEYAGVIRDIVIPRQDKSKNTTHRVAGIFRQDVTYGYWPTFTCLWRYEGGWDAYVSQYKSASAHDGHLWKDEQAIYYVNTAGKYRQRSFERMLMPVGFSPQPSPRPAVTSPNSVIVKHDFMVVPGRGAQFVKEAARSLVAQAQDRGLRLELFGKTVGRPLEFVAFWSLPSLDAYAALQNSRNPDDESTFLPGISELWPYLTDVTEKFLLPMKYSPLGGAG